MSSSSFRSLTCILLIFLFAWSATFETCNARRGKHWRDTRSFTTSLYKKKGKNHGSSYHHSNGSKSKSNTSSPIAPAPPAPKPKDDISPAPPKKEHDYVAAATFDVIDFGAKGDGTTDDTKAFQAAWAAACKVEASTIVVPSKYVFVVRPVSFSGPYHTFGSCLRLSRFDLSPTYRQKEGLDTAGPKRLWAYHHNDEISAVFLHLRPPSHRSLFPAAI